MTLRTGGDTTLKPGDAVGLAFAPEAVHFFDQSGQALRASRSADA